MLPVAECNLEDFLENYAFDSEDGSPLHMPVARSFFGCLVSALSYLHENRIRHKDIKPRHILVSQPTIWFSDFGAATDWSENGQAVSSGMQLGYTRRYYASEVATAESRNSRSDLWSLGCVFLEISTILKGKTIKELLAFLKANGTTSPCYQENISATLLWVELLESELSP